MITVIPGVHGAIKKRVPSGSTAFVELLGRLERSVLTGFPVNPGAATSDTEFDVDFCPSRTAGVGDAWVSADVDEV